MYGPPGCGKTLIARQIGNLLNCRPPKIVNGPEVLNKYVGASEENVRKLFADAEAEWAEKGEESDIHLIIFDEIDAICKQRGTVSSGTGVNDSGLFFFSTIFHLNSKNHSKKPKIQLSTNFFPKLMVLIHQTTSLSLV